MATTVHQPQMGLSFEQVWAALMETKNIVRENAVQQKKTEEAVRKMAEKVEEVSKNVGGLNRSVGELIETLIAARLWEKFNAYSYNFQRAYQRVEMFDETNRKLTDIDILLSNGEYVMAVEVKRELDDTDDVDHHLKRMEYILKYTPDQCKGKKLLGAIAGGTVNPDVQAYAHSVGFFVLELTGESVKLAETPKGFEPRQW
jgi:molybdenum-dependent DNA-binding transcriptional regulator ModE